MRGKAFTLLEKPDTMKKALLFFVFAACSLSVYAQVFVDGIQVDQSNAGAYLEVIALHKEDETYHFVADYGQKRQPGLTKGDFLTDSQNRRYEFRSPVDGLNFLFENGWEVSTVYVYKDIRHYLMRPRR